MEKLKKSDLLPDDILHFRGGSCIKLKDMDGVKIDETSLIELYTQDLKCLLEDDNYDIIYIERGEKKPIFEKHSVKIGTPIERNILVIKPKDHEVETDNGLIMNTESLDKPYESKVVGVGQGIADIKEGDTVLFSKKTGILFEYENESYIVLRYDEVLIIK